HCSLVALLRRAARYDYVRKNESSRDYPHKKQPDPPAGLPATAPKSNARINCETRHKKGLTA
ncbi:MAG: hypothetical protein KDA62_15325, partial [Planctomycetales bacterium]|nr:hypothetical protein [Planctomycetales bacterium]